jgi:hypothetical protein
MDLKALEKLRRKLESLQSSPGNISSRRLVRFAESLGRRRVKKQTGEPMYVSDVFPHLRPIPIPAHPRIAIPKTAIKILTWLEAFDFQEWEKLLQQHEIQKQKKRKGVGNENG